MMRTVGVWVLALAVVSGVAGMTLIAQQGQGGSDGWNGRRGGRHSGPPDPQTVVKVSCYQIARIHERLGALNLSSDTSGLASVVSSLINDLGPAASQCETFRNSAQAAPAK